MSTAALLTCLPLLVLRQPRLLGIAAHAVGRLLLRVLIGLHLASAAQGIHHGVPGQVLLSVATVGLALRLLVLHGRQQGGPDHGGGGGGGGGGRGPGPAAPTAGPWSGRGRVRPQRSSRRHERSGRRVADPRR